MGALLSLPLLGSFGGLLGTLASSCLAGLTFFCTSQAATAFCKSCNCNSSVATRIGFSIIFLLNSMVAWIMLTPAAIHQIEKWSYSYIKMSCEEGKCYGVLAVHRICFALTLFHLILSSLLVGVHDTRIKRAAIQNGWWGPKVLAWVALIVTSFAIPNGFFIFWGNYVSLVGAAVFILIGLVLLVDFAHSWSEHCLERWEETDSSLWKFVLVGSTLGMYAFTVALTVVDYVYFTPSGCGLNQFFVTFNLILSLAVSVMCVLPAVQEANYKSGLAQAGMVTAYCAYVVTSAVATHDDAKCNPLNQRASGARTSMVVAGAIFTFLAIAYSTSRAATQSKAMAGTNKKRGGVEAPSRGGYARVPGADHGGELGIVTSQPSRRDALMAAVAAGAIPASALDEDDESDPGAPHADEMDDELGGTRYNYSWFHIIFALGAMYVAMLLTNWNVIAQAPASSPDTPPGEEYDFVKIGRSDVAMWIRIVSSWLCLFIYAWSLLAPVLLPERFEGLE